MNAKAEKFRKFVEEIYPGVFQIDEVPNDPDENIIFRSFITVHGQQFPTVAIIDNSVFITLRTLIAPRALDDNNSARLLKFVNKENQLYKPFKLFIDDDGDILLESCLVSNDDNVDTISIFLIFDVIAQYLTNTYRKIMKLVWAGIDDLNSDVKYH